MLDISLIQTQPPEYGRSWRENWLVSRIWTFLEGKLVSRIWTFLEGKLSRLGNTMEEDDSVSFLMEMVIGRL